MAFGFFKRLFSKKDSSSGIPKELSGVMSQILTVVFPGGEIQMHDELNDLSSILGVPASRIEGTFKYACTRVFLGREPDIISSVGEPQVPLPLHHIRRVAVIPIMPQSRFMLFGVVRILL